MNFLLAGKYLVLLIAIESLLTGMIVLITKKPLIINSVYRNLSIVPLLIAAYLLTGDQEFIINNIFILVMLIVLITVISSAFKGITVLGSRDERLQELTAEFLRKNNAEIEQIPTAIYVKNNHNVWLFSSVAKYGIQSISVKGRESSRVVNALIKELRTNNLQYCSGYMLYTLFTGLVLLALYFVN